MKSLLIGMSLLAVVAVGLATFNTPAEAAVPSSEARAAVGNVAQAAVPSSAFHEAVVDTTLEAVKWQARLATDGGATALTQVVCLSSINQTVLLASIPATGAPNGPEYCYKTCSTSTCVPDCTKDFRPNLGSVELTVVTDGGFTATNTFKPGSMIGSPIAMSQDKCVVASAVDGGSLALQMYIVTKNPGQQ